MPDSKINIVKQVAFWRESAAEDWDVGRDLVKRGKTRHGLFFLHLALEKMLKAHVCRETGDFAPKIHALLVLANKAKLTLSDEQEDFLAEFDRFNIQGRYPAFWAPALGASEAKHLMAWAEEMYSWLAAQF